MAKIAEQSGLVGIVNHRKGATTGAEFLRNQVDSSINVHLSYFSGGTSRKNQNFGLKYNFA